jgi:hypothetical protein
MKAARSVNHRGLPGGGGLWSCMRRPQQLYGPRGMSVRARALRCKQLFSLNCGFLPRSCCAIAHWTARSVLGKSAFATWGGSALQRRGPSPGGLLGFSGPAAPCALLTTRYGKLRTRAWPALLLHRGSTQGPSILQCFSAGAKTLLGQVKSRVTPRGNMKAARSVNHRSLPGGGGLRLCMRRPQQLYGPRGVSVRARALRC